MLTKHILYSIIFVIFLNIGFCDHHNEPSNDLDEDGSDSTSLNKMYVYSNFGKIFYLMDYKTFEVVEEIQLNVADTISCQGMILSTNRDFLFFQAEGSDQNPFFGFAIYNIKKDELKNIFFTELEDMGPAYFISAQNYSEPGLIYVHFRDYGTYAVDLFEQRIKELVSDEHDFVLDKRIFFSPDNQWIIVHKQWNGDIKGSFSELEFYTNSSGLHDLQFVLNKNDIDSISVYDFEFSNADKLCITFQLSNGRSRGIESYFGSYDLETKQLYRSSIKFPWSLNPYYTAYSSSRNEVYTIGGYDKFYIIDTGTYEIKSTVLLTDKIGGSSRIIITPNEDVAFVSCPSSNSIFAIDLNNRQVIKEINFQSPYRPYNMIIP